MTDASVQISAGSGTKIRVLTGLGTDSADQQVVTLADSAGNLLGTTAAGFPVNGGTVSPLSSTLTASIGNTTGVTSGTGQYVISAAIAGSISIGISGTYSATLVFEQCMDAAGAVWFPCLGQPSDASQAVSSTGAVVNLVRMFDFGTSGISFLRVRCSTFVSGTVTVYATTDGMPADPVVASIAVQPTIGTLTSVAAATSSTSLLAANSLRRQALFFNDSSANLYLAFASSASTTAYTVKVGPFGYYEQPIPAYVGAIFGIWDTATGNVRITELT